MKKLCFFEKTVEQNLGQILLDHIFKTHEKNKFFQLTGFLTDVMAQKPCLFCTITSSLTNPELRERKRDGSSATLDR